MQKKVLIIAYLDGFANSYKPLEIKKYLESKGHHVKIINTQYISRFTSNKNNILYYFPSLYLLNFWLYIFEAISFIQKRYFVFTKKYTYYYILIVILKLRAKILSEKLKKIEYNFLICESQYDSGIFEKNLYHTSLYDCPTPWADELFFGNELTKNQYKHLKTFELKIYANVDYLSFHWESYGEYVKKFYKYEKNNVIILNKGCIKTKLHAKFNKKPRIIYLGYLGGYWINLPLLAKLSKLYPDIDIYGYPRPDKKYKLNYKGYADTSIISKYQFGLISITKDQLRQNGFSAKHLDYISFGMPVLVPEWRVNAASIGGSILFNENNFLEKIKLYSQKKHWQKISNDAMDQSQSLTTNKVLKPLDKILETLK
jgi:hypothetical protein